MWRLPWSIKKNTSRPSWPLKRQDSFKLKRIECIRGIARLTRTGVKVSKSRRSASWSPDHTLYTLEKTLMLAASCKLHRKALKWPTTLSSPQNLAMLVLKTAKCATFLPFPYKIWAHRALNFYLAYFVVIDVSSAILASRKYEPCGAT